MTTTSEPPAERFARLYVACYLPVLRFIARRSGAEDLAHETFVTAWRRLDTVPLDEDGAQAWLFTVARNFVLNAQRARRRPTELSVELGPEAITDASAAGDESLWAARLAVAEAWRALAPGEQEVLALAVWEGLPSADAARVLGISPGAYRVRHGRARADLARHLDRAGAAPTAR
ncbi:RNA polymerase sigma factor [Brachybacterium huguangmaarense]